MTTSISKLFGACLLASLALNQLATAQNLSMASPKDFSESAFENSALPQPRCNTSVAAQNLQESVKMSPLPTFDGVSPWPGLFGFWVHEDAGIYVVVNGKTSYESLFGRSTNKVLQVQVKLYSLCGNELIGKGTTTLKSAGASSRNQVIVRLGNHSIKNISSPFITLSRLGDPKTQKPLINDLGLTLKYRPGVRSRASFVEESILLKNVLNLQ